MIVNDPETKKADIAIKIQNDTFTWGKKIRYFI